MDNKPDWRTGAYKLSREEQLAVVNWLFSIPFEEMIAIARLRLQKSFPNAPSKMIGCAEFHLYVDGRDDALLWLAELALFIKDENAEPPSLAVAWQFLYHLYNWFNGTDQRSPAAYQGRRRRSSARITPMP